MYVRAVTCGLARHHNHTRPAQHVIQGIAMPARMGSDLHVFNVAPGVAQEQLVRGRSSLARKKGGGRVRLLTPDRGSQPSHRAALAVGLMRRRGKGGREGSLHDTLPRTASLQTISMTRDRSDPVRCVASAYPTPAHHK